MTMVREFVAYDDSIIRTSRSRNHVLHAGFHNMPLLSVKVRLGTGEPGFNENSEPHMHFQEKGFAVTMSSTITSTQRD
jgi:hypothetical protein